MYVTGIGRTKFGTLTDTMPELIYQAMYNAIIDTPVSIEEIEAVYVSNFLGGPSEKQLHLNSVVSSLLPELRLPIIRVETACASGSSALFQAIIALSRFENMLVISKCHNGSKKSFSCICVPMWQRYRSLSVSRKYSLIYCLRKSYYT